jgi:hypothetical protein
VERGDLRVAAPPRQCHRLPHDRRCIRRKRLLNRAAAGTHLSKKAGKKSNLGWLLLSVSLLSRVSMEWELFCVNF